MSHIKDRAKIYLSYAGYEKVSAGLHPSRLKARSLFALDRHF